MSDSSRPKNSPGQNTGVSSSSLISGDLPKPGIELRSPALQGDSLPAEPQGKLSQFKLRNKLSGESGICHYIKNLTLGYYLAAKVLLFTV